MGILTPMPGLNQYRDWGGYIKDKTTSNLKQQILNNLNNHSFKSQTRKVQNGCLYPVSFPFSLPLLFRILIYEYEDIYVTNHFRKSFPVFHDSNHSAYLMRILNRSDFTPLLISTAKSQPSVKHLPDRRSQATCKHYVEHCAGLLAMLSRRKIPSHLPPGTGCQENF